jgi:hypothetical protein
MLSQLSSCSASARFFPSRRGNDCSSCTLDCNSVFVVPDQKQPLLAVLWPYLKGTSYSHALRVGPVVPACTHSSSQHSIG